jgi:NAD(P)-dependent dehydrogenase (short-subunit alcohol dehydrogenase family)
MGLEATFAVNHLAPFILTHLLAEPLMAAAPSRVVNVTSYLHNMVKSIPWDDLQAESNYRSHAVYDLTKLMNILFTYQLAKRWAGKGVSANCLHPGWPLKTDLGREERGIAGLFDRASKLFASSAENGSRTTVYLASSQEVEGVTGSYFSSCKAAKSSKLSHDELQATRLWERSSELCGA